LNKILRTENFRIFTKIQSFIFLEIPIYSFPRMRRFADVKRENFGGLTHVRHSWRHRLLRQEREKTWKHVRIIFSDF